MPPKLEESEIKKYWEIFNGLGPVSGKLSGERCSPIFKNSRLGDNQLGRVWDLADIDSDGQLDFEEFCIAMRFIFDLINGNIQELPEYLPDWLVPASKGHLIQADRALNNIKVPNAQQSDDDDDDESSKLSDDFDWYLSPTDKSTYESIYTTAADHFGRVRFESLTDLYAMLSKVPQTDISSGWNLVNPKSFETIDKDQCLVFLHILNQRENGKRVPRGVPASLRATFSKETPNYNLDSYQSKVKPAAANVSRSSADNYLNRMGITSSSQKGSSGTDFSATKGTDWEEVRLRQELDDLIKKIENAEKAASEKKDITNDKTSMVKYEFEQLLKYKEDQLARANGAHDSEFDGIKSDLDLIESQVVTLEEYLSSKQQELSKLQQDLQQAKA